MRIEKAEKHESVKEDPRQARRWVEGVKRRLETKFEITLNRN